MRIYCCLRAGFHAEAVQVGVGQCMTDADGCRPARAQPKDC